MCMKKFIKAVIVGYLVMGLIEALFGNNNRR